MSLFDFGCIVGMDADAGENPIVSCGDRNATPHLIRACTIPDRQNLPNTCIPGALNYSIAIGVKARIVKMSVGVNEHALSNFISIVRRSRLPHGSRQEPACPPGRSEERRVGKESRSR